jgi:hypothetical protein
MRWIALLCCTVFAAGESPGANASVTENEVLLDLFETDSPDWKYIGGWEFPGAKGSLDRVGGEARDVTFKEVTR